MVMEGIFGEAVDKIGGQPIAARMARKAPIRHLDPILLLLTLALVSYGALMVYSATVHKQLEADLDPGFFLKRQLISLAVGLVVLTALTFFDYRWIKGVAPMIYGGTVLALVLVLTPLGHVQAGARRWINIGAYQLQPSELAKIALILTLSAFLASKRGEIGLVDVVIAIAMVLVPGALIYLEPDLGTMIVFVVIGAALLFMAGTKIRHLVALAALGMAAVAFIFQAGLLKDYQLDRLTVFLDPNPDVQSVGYNVTQSKITIGSGGMTGKGLEGKNTQTSLDFVPEQHTDFIFTAVGEQLGFLGSATLLALLAFLIWRALRIAAMARDMYGTLVASGIAAFWAFQVFVNIGMTMGIMPITGVPLPFISYGGSSLITNFIAVGLLLNIHMRRYV
ncbi:MAG TPA: rod shape-determining protein RodA [Actinomycetota bacterium]|nr:rod shape-determining protein RodA [Actinomycetota bacterium]